jgi:hypothetical protein
MLPTEFAIYQTRPRAEFFCVWDTRHSAVLANLPQYEKFTQCSPRDERPENWPTGPPEWAEIFLADRPNSSRNNKYSTGGSKKLFSLRYNFFLNPRHS